MFKIVWDKQYNGVKLTMSSAGEALNIPPRPVFYEELDLLGLDKQGWKYPRVKAPLLWACERRYFYKGEVVMEVHGGNMFDHPTITIADAGKDLILEPVDISRLRELNEDSMFILEHEAMNFINETYRRYKGLADVSKKNPDADFQQLAAIQSKKTKEEHVVIKESCDSFDIMPLAEAERQGKAPILSSKIEMFIASFSGGKDSAVMLDLTARVVPPEDLIVIYSDTGYELPTSLKLYKEIQNHYKNIYPELRFYTARNHQPVLYYWDKMDSPSRIHRWCCAVMKTAPLYRLLKEINGTDKQPNVLAFEGVRAEESEARSQYARIGRGVKHNNVINARPIFEWSTTEIWLYLLFKDIPLNHAYRKGLNRVGCVVCPLSSEFGDCLDNQLFPETAKPFIDKLKDNAKKSGVRNIDDYIKLRKWKVRAGGNRYNSQSHLEIISEKPDLIANIINPQENILVWLNTIGTFNYKLIEDKIEGTIKYKNQIYAILVSYNNDSISIKVENVGEDVLFIGHLKRVLNKSAYCVHCEVCEVECPTGALSVVPFVRIDTTKCIHCHKCLDFIDNGCEVANSIKKTIGIIQNHNNMSAKSTINRYNTFGLREQWLSFFFANYKTYFSNENHGLNIKKQLPIFKKWLWDAEILKAGEETITDSGYLCSTIFITTPNIVWEIIWINLCNNSELCSWYIENIGFNKTINRDEINNMFADSFSQYTEPVRENSLKSFQNTLKESPYSNNIPVGVVNKAANKVSIIRLPYNDLSLCATAYSLYRYAESIGRKRLTISEFYKEEQPDGIYRQFGIERSALERKLRSLQEDDNRVLTVELNMGLDNIILRDDLNAKDILQLFLK